MWQAHYQKSNMQIIEAITWSAHLYQTPINQMGFGIPNYSLANALLLDIDAIDEVTLDIYPNPSSNAKAYLYTANHTDISYRLVDVGGREIYKEKRLVPCLDFYRNQLYRQEYISLKLHRG